MPLLRQKFLKADLMHPDFDKGVNCSGIHCHEIIDIGSSLCA